MMTGRFATAGLVEWIGLQRCHTPTRHRGKYLEHCEGDLDGNSYCWRHDMSWEHATRLLRWQVRRPVATPKTHQSFYCEHCKDTGSQVFSCEDALYILGIRPEPYEPCDECPRCVVCCVEASRHTDAQVERCMRELQEDGDSILPERLTMRDWMPTL